jgi:hypothetical protein
MKHDGNLRFQFVRLFLCFLSALFCLVWCVTLSATTDLLLWLGPTVISALLSVGLGWSKSKEILLLFVIGLRGFSDWDEAKSLLE